MNILYTITSYPPSMGGAQLYLHEIAKRAKEEHNIQVFSFFNTNRNDWLMGTTLRTPCAEVNYTLEGVKVKLISFNNEEKLRLLPHVSTYYINKMYNIACISKLIEKKLYPIDRKIDLIHNVRVGREPLSYASYYLAKRLKIPFIFTPLHHPRWNHWFFKEYQNLYRKADGLFALTPYEKELYQGFGVETENIFVTGTGAVLSNQANPERFKEKYGISGNLILFIGQGYKYKGIQDLLNAAKIVFNHAKNVDFVFIGPHTSYSSRLFKRERDIRIKHIGKVDLQTKTDALAACDIFCLPSRQESFGAVFLEAWCFGKPVIGADIPQLNCVIENGINGYLVAPNPKKIAQRIMDLLNDSGMRARLGLTGKKMVEENFTWDILYRKTITDYQKIIENYKKNA